MKIYFGQIYVEPGVAFPFSTQFQQRLGAEVTSLVLPSTGFVEKYGIDWDVMIRVSAKTKIENNEVLGPWVCKRDQDVEHTVFLPYDVISQANSGHEIALQFLLDGTCEACRRLGLDPSPVEESSSALIGRICGDPEMFSN